jgi:hypothetical protein
MNHSEETEYILSNYWKSIDIQLFEHEDVEYL